MLSNTMRAAVLTRPGRFEIREVATPVCGPHEVLVKVARVGICGTDVHIFKGHYASDRLPLIPGHEFAGTVAKVGGDVSTISLGQKVIADINIGCGHCFYCRKNEVLNCPDMRQLGIHIDGAFGEYVKIPDRLVIPISVEMPFEVAAIVEPLACSVRAFKKSAIHFGESVVVIGAGPLGNLHTQLARAIGAAPIITADLNASRLKIAAAVGADFVVSDLSNLDAVVRAATEGRGADVVIESVGHAALYEMAFALVRPGGRIAAFGLTGDEARASYSPRDVVLKEIGMKGSVAAMGDDMHDALTLLRYGRIDPAPFLQATRRLEDTQAAIEEFINDPKILKVQIEI
jgi:2-desacetyl-2-hydroxyethyl bacteriochlorophyllide A dehydrogenase